MAQLKSFKSFSNDRVKSVVITFGRFQPFTQGHVKVFDKIESLAKGNNYRIYTSQTVDDKKNPLPYKEKIKFLRKAFPQYGRNIIEDTSIRTIFDALSSLTKQGFTKVTVVVGSDRIPEFTRTLLKYNGIEGRHGFYNFPDGLNLASSGDRDPDSDDVATAMSATKMRNAAIENNFDLFSKGLPKEFKEKIDLFKAVRAGLGLKESVIAREHIQLASVSEDRERFVEGKLYTIGDMVRIKESTQVGEVISLGPNFVVVDVDGTSYKKWLTALEKI